MKDNKLLETVADLAYAAGCAGYYSGDSRADVANIILLAKEFEKMHELTDWLTEDYILAIDSFAEQYLEQSVFQ